MLFGEMEDQRDGRPVQTEREVYLLFAKDKHELKIHEPNPKLVYNNESKLYWQHAMTGAQHLTHDMGQNK